MHALLLAVALASLTRVVDASGDVTRTTTNGVTQSLGRGSALEEDEVVRTGADGHVRLLVNETAVVDLGPESSMHVTTSAGHTQVKLSLGRLWARVSRLFGGDRFSVETPTAVAGVRGTSFFAEIDGDTTTVSVEAGSVEVADLRGEHALIGADERVRTDSRSLSRTSIDHETLAGLRERIATRERGDLSDRDLRQAVEHRLSTQGEGRPAAAREAIREAMKLRRDTPLDIDPGQAKRYLERLRALRERRSNR